MSDGVTCEYICSCGTFQFTVRYRGRDEDILHWVEQAVRPAMGEAHVRNAPMCMMTAADLKIPVPEGTHGIGMRVEH